MYLNKITIRKTVLFLTASTLVLSCCGCSYNNLDVQQKQGSVILLNDKTIKEESLVQEVYNQSPTIKVVQTPLCTPVIQKDKSEKIPVGAVICKKNNIFIYKEQSREITELGESDQPKQFIGLSPQKNKIAYTYGFIDNDNSSTARKIGVYDIETGKVTDLNLSETVYQIMEIYWTDNNTIMAVGHINPSTNMYQCFDVEKEKSLYTTPVSILYDVSADGRNIIYYFTQHFGERQLPHIKITDIQKMTSEEEWLDEPIYKVTEAENEINFVKFYDNDKKIIFGEYIAKENRSILNFADINEKSISITKKVPLGIKLSETAECKYFEELSQLFFIGDDLSGKNSDQSAFYLNVLNLNSESKIDVKSIKMESELYTQHKFDIRLFKGTIYIDDTVIDDGLEKKSTYILSDKSFEKAEQQSDETNTSSANLNEAIKKHFNDMYVETVKFF